MNDRNCAFCGNADELLCEWHIGLKIGGWSALRRRNRGKLFGEA